MNVLGFSPVDIHGLTEARLTILSQQLFLAKIAKEHLQQKLSNLLRLIFFDQGSSSFLSLTEANNEISLILDKDSLDLLGKANMIVSKQYYRAIQIYEGEDVIDEPGYVHQFTLPLTKAGIPVIYLSTYNTDIILMEEDKLNRAYNILHELFPKLFFVDSNTRIKLSNQRNNKPQLKQNLSNKKSNGNTKGMELTQLPNKLVLASFARSRIPDLSFCLLKLLLDDPFIEERFFSLTITADEVSLIVEASTLDQLPIKFLSEFQRNSHSWRAIQISAGVFGFAGSGAVGKISEILANQNISIYYLSTFDEDFILVQEAKVQEAIACLQSEDNYSSC